MFSLDGRLVALPNSFAMLPLMVDLLAVVRISYPDLKMANMKSQADCSKGSSCLMLFLLYPLRLYCLRKHAMC